MFFIKAVLSFLLILWGASDVVADQGGCDDYYRDKNNTPIDVKKYCLNKLCITKCCGPDENLNLRGDCMKSRLLNSLKSQIDYTKITLYSWDGSAVKESKRTLKDFIQVQNRKMANRSCTYEHSENDFKILEDGSLKVENPNDLKPFIDVAQLEYCIDFRVVIKENTTLGKLNLVLRESIDPVGDSATKSAFTATGMLISCFFMLLVLAVYCLLRQLRNIVGLVLMAYTSSLFVTYLIKAVLALTSYGTDDCKIISPFMYFTAVSSFFWLNIMSFDVWWTLRGNRKCREIHRRGELVKFAWYCLYAWGTPCLMAIGATILDNVDLTNWPSIIKPPFEDCFVNEGGMFIYMNIPIAIITVVNIILFLMTAYNIWQIKRGIHNCQDSGKSKQETYRFVIYVKLSVIMGVSWCLELIPVVTLWLYIMVNLYNLLIGVVIFFLFVFKKKIFIMLCKRFGILKDFVEKMQPSVHSRSGTTRTTGYSSKNSTSHSHVRDSQV